MGRQPNPFNKVPTGQDDIDRLQDRLVETLRTISSNPMLAIADFRFVEVAGNPPSLALQFRGVANAWSTVATFTSAGILSTAVASNGGSAFLLDAAPSSPDSRDDEFTGTAFTGWTQVGSWVSAAFDHYSDFTTATTVRYDWNVIRPSWLMTQTARAAGFTAINKAVAWNTNDQVYVKITCGIPLPGSTILSGVYIGIGQTAAGIFDANNRVMFEAFWGAGGMSYQIEKTVGGANTVVGSYSSTTAPNPVIYMLAQKIGTTYYLWVAGSDGTWRFVTSTTAAITPDRIQIYFQDGGGAPAAPLGPPVCGIDFIRFRASTVLLPGCG